MSDSPSWWKDMLTRRQASQRTALVGAALAGVGAASTLTACKKDDKEADAKTLQEQHGWNVGYGEEGITLTDTVDVDSLGNTDWQSRRTPEALLEATRPPSERWRSHESPSLFQSLAQPTLAEAIQPIRTEEMDRAYGVGRALGELVDASQDPQKTMIVIDLPGAQSVAAAAGMSPTTEPVFWLDNWPHPRGVVPSELPLAATLYYAAEFEQSAPQRQPQHAISVVLDRARLTTYTNAASQFDNRYMAELPSPQQLSSYGIDKVVYLTESASNVIEADDLNEYFVDYNKRNIDVVMLHLDQFGVDPDAAVKQGEVARYWYGGQEQSHTQYYRHHGMFLFIPGPRYGWGSGNAAAARVRPTHYRPTARQTMFSSRTAGASAGVGRQRPSGFGRITHSTGRGGAVTNMRSGSYGRYSSGVSG